MGVHSLFAVMSQSAFSVSDFPAEEFAEAHKMRKEKKLKRAKKVHGSEKQVTMFGKETVKCRRGVRILVGPVIGKVTATTAIVLVEVDASSSIHLHLVPESGDSIVIEKHFDERIPSTFYVQNLQPETSYQVAIGGVEGKFVRRHTGLVKTFSESPQKLRVAVVSCDRPERHLAGEELMWKKLWQRIQAGEIDIMLHVGDQVYAQKESMDASAIYRHGDFHDAETEEERSKRLVKTFIQARNRLSDVYRFTWSLPYTQRVLAHVPHFMIWSDNDIFNDFTIAEGASPLLVKLGQQCYRLYQRALWDEDITDDQHHSEEQHFHKYGNLGIMMLDMRGNRVDVEGNQSPDNPVVSETQWSQIEAMLADDDIKVIMCCSEIPFISDPPEVVKEGAKKIPFLADHWAYNDSELFRLLDMLSDWKAAGNGTRDVVLVGGDIHVGHTTVLHDNKNNLDIKQITTSPITNHVCDFFPKLENNLSERYSYVHKVLDSEKNYGYFEIDTTGDAGEITPSLVGSATTLTF